MQNHYVKNKDFLIALKEYRKEVLNAKEFNLPKPRVSEYIGECICKIATRVSFKSNFVNYTYRDEMVSDSIETCLLRIDNFDPEKSSNPFAYFTRIIMNAFIGRIQKEKKQSIIKGKIILNLPFDVYDIQEHDADNTYTNTFIEFMQNNEAILDLVRSTEKKEKEKSKIRRQRKVPTLEDSFE